MHLCFVLFCAMELNFVDIYTCYLSSIKWDPAFTPIESPPAANPSGSSRWINATQPLVFAMGIAEVLNSINVEHESFPTYGDFAILPLFAIFFPTVRFFLDRFLFERVGRWLIFGKGQQKLDVETDDRNKKIRKFKESAWKCVYYLSAETLALAVTYNEPWFTDTNSFWLGPGDQRWPDQKMKLKLKGLYMYTGGFYTYSIFALIFWETRRSDFGVSMGHHVATVILIAMSYICRFARAGSVVLALHDASDVFLEVGKMSKYSGAEALASFSFILFVLSWVVLRLIYYPFWILWSTSYQVVQTLDKEKHVKEGPLYYYVFNTLLFCLLVLHIYWWVLMYRMLVKQIQDRGKLSDDVRSDSDMLIRWRGDVLPINLKFAIGMGSCVIGATCIDTESNCYTKSTFVVACWFTDNC
ncbi:hypothetical protein L6452_13513 [Arctium lappa]|uniref:Uncharacterized protein n=1 Tax=Arctium lappa TaxID=4217 RepID=A0ACB9CIT6_ARCLA|nr:hypothetical protein L6452_13513 [Arctium lappa]